MLKILLEINEKGPEMRYIHVFHSRSNALKDVKMVQEDIQRLKYARSLKMEILF
jgi:hypothetical protein